MPNNYDFSIFKNIKDIEVFPINWVKPLIVEYVVDYYSDVPTCFWRVKGTDHTFTIPFTQLNYLSSGNYKEHFEKSLSIFRDDYIEWKNRSFDADWMKQYQKQFENLIIC